MPLEFERAEHPSLETFGSTEFQYQTLASLRIMADMEHFQRLLIDWSQRINLVGPSALTQFWLRHGFDSAQLLSFAPGRKLWADLGTGAGFPGIVLAIMLKDVPGAKVHLIESMTKRTRFLSEVVQTLSLPATVHTMRAEQVILSAPVEVVTARACAPLSKLLGFAAPSLTGTNFGLFLKGRTADAELIEARRMWRFQGHVHQSLSDMSGRIVQIQDLRRA